MIRHNIKLILRSLRRLRLYSAINIIGLAVGFSAVALIVLYIRFELSYDRYHAKADRIFRVTRQYDHPGGYRRHFARVPDVWINDLPGDFPEIEQLIRFQAFPFREIKVADQKFRDEQWFVTDQRTPARSLFARYWGAACPA